MASAFASFTVSRGPCTFQLRTAGSGPPLWYLHDETSAAPGALAGQLAERFQVFAPVVPGFGDSERPEWVETSEDVAHVLLDLVDAVTPDGPLTLVGPSIGGWIAAELAILLGRRVAAAVLVAPAGLYVPEEPPADHWFMHDADRDRTLFADPANKPEITPDEAYANDSMAARLGWNPRLASKRLGHKLHRITAPTLVVWGAEDRLLPPSYAQRWVDLLGNGTAEIVPGGAHFLGIEQCDVVAAAARGFLDRHVATLPEAVR
ncbi:MAG TPA: alpha/beta hydrolase [Acidimicrobiales bacterium]